MTEGLFDFIGDGKILAFVEMARAIKSGDKARIRAAALEVARALGYGADAKELDDVVKEIEEGDWGGAMVELGELLILEGNRFRKTPLDGPKITTMARKNIKDMTAADCETWLADNKANIRKGADSAVCRFATRKMPDVQQALEGKMTTAQLETMALDPDKVVAWLNRAIIVLTAASIFYPPLGAVVVVLKLILARYESNNPDVGLPLTALAE
jgi:hypothetical protein